MHSTLGKQHKTKTKMDSNPSLQQAAATPTPSNETTPSTPASQLAQPQSGGFSFSHLELGASILETVQMAAALDTHVKEIIHVPKARLRLTDGFLILGNMHGALFAMIADQANYARDAFYDACEAHRKAKRDSFEREQMAKMAGLTLEEFDAKFAEANAKLEVDKNKTL